ncbi:MAG: MgtC/SapB family protein [Anaerolineales bacterium]|nr:MgtC/SapB family protein [Anaerolineales bacterium]
MASTPQWPFVPILAKLGLALALGIFIGLEREKHGKEAGIRTFGFVSLLGCIGALLGNSYALLALGLTGILIVFLNLQRLQTNKTTGLTTSAALLVVGFNGVLCGMGHTFTPTVIGICTAFLLAWKDPLTEFSVGLTEQEIRSAILLAVIAFIVYPVLPDKAIDPWGLVEVRTAWETVILLAAIGFVNYILLKLYGAKGIELSGFLGGLVNSTVAATELAVRVREVGAALTVTAFHSITLANIGMLIRNGVLLGILSLDTLPYAVIPLTLMLVSGLLLLWVERVRHQEPQKTSLNLKFQSPFSLSSALKFGIIFVVLQAAGNLAQRYLGAFGFYAVSFAGGIVSSTSAVASAATLAVHGQISNQVAANGAFVASVASVLIDPILVARIAQNKSLNVKLFSVLGAVALVGVVAAVLQSLLGV